MQQIHHEVFDPDDRDAPHELVIDYTFKPGAKPTGPSWGDPGDPGYPPEVEIVRARNSLTYETITLTEAERTRITESLCETHRDPEPEYER